MGSQLESIDKKTEDTMNSLKELQQVCANVLKEFHQVRVIFLKYLFFPTTSGPQEDKPR